MKEIDYLLAPLVKCAKETKQRKKAVRQENIEKGSRLSKASICAKYGFLTSFPSGEV